MQFQGNFQQDYFFRQDHSPHHIVPLRSTDFVHRKEDNISIDPHESSARALAGPKAVVWSAYV